jgi:hypothetical protein
MKTPRTLIIGAFALMAVAVSSCADSGTTATTAAPATMPSAGASPVQVSLARSFNLQGIYPDGAQFTGGIDGDGFTCSSNLLTTTQTSGGVSYQLGSAINGSNVVSCHAQSIPLPAGNFSKVQMLAIAVNGAQSDQTLSVAYADNSNQSFTQSFSDWAQPDSNTGESQAITMDYRDQSDGTKDENTYYIFSYTFALNATKAVQSLKLPDNDNIKIFAVTLVP